ncbi:MAG: oligoendopeptidase F [Bacillota bacterium]|nr:oligoendopeptidase F [Bacillota bacterium]
MELKSVKRSEVEEKYTWDLTDMAKDENEFRQGLDKVVADLDAFEKAYKGKLENVDIITKMIEDYEDIYQRYNRFAGYAYLQIATDQGNHSFQEYQAYAGNVGALMDEKLAFVESDLIQLDESILKEAEKIHANKSFIKDVLRAKAHYLGADVEQALSSISRVFRAPYNIYAQAKHADLSFSDFELDGKTYPNSFVLFENYYEGLKDTDVRRAAFDAFSKDLGKYQHTMAGTMSAQVYQEKSLAKLRGFDSVIDYLLYEQEVTREMYDRQIDILMEDFAPIMRRYVELVKRVNKLDKLTYPDLKIALDPDFTETITIEEAKPKLMEGLKILGEDYVEMIRRAFDERWIDFPINDGKQNGAFCSSPYGVHPYILNSWTGSLEDLFVLGHELGHAGHFYLAGQAQNLSNTRPSLYFIESPSTTNELIIGNHMLTWNDDPAFQRFVYSSIISRTYYHNMVTHLLEAHFQREVYKLVDQGKGLSATVLNDLFTKTLEKFWGDTVELTDGAELTWMRQLHYYRGLYPYTYSAGLTIGTVVSQKIVDQGQPAVDAWRSALKAGGTEDSVGLAKIAGVDITTDQALRDTLKYLDGVVSKIEELTDQIEGK